MEALRKESQTSLAKQTTASIPRDILLSLFGFFILSRLVIVHFYSFYVSDVERYYQWAIQGVVQGKTAYLNFSFPYPPLALPLIYMPMQLLTYLNDHIDYRNAFQLEMLLIECILFYVLLQYAFSILKLKGWRIAAVGGIYSTLGLLQGHLLYDRIDVIVSLVFVLIIFSFSRWQTSRWIHYTFGILGTITKLVPGLILIATAIIRSVDQGKSSVGNSMKEIFKAIIPIFLFLLIYDYSTEFSLSTCLYQHEQRGIQVESVWATPWMLKRVLTQDRSLQIKSNYGAQHLGKESIPTAYLMLSKYAGFLLFAGMICWLWACLIKSKNSNYFPPHLFLLTCFTIFLTFLGSQRVLSPQFFIWLMPSVSLLSVSCPNRLVNASFLALYALTYYGFDIGYWSFVAFEPKFVYAIALRNVILLGLCIYFLWIWATSIKRWSQSG